MPQRGRGRGGFRHEYGRYSGGVRYVLVTREATDATDGVGGVAPEFTQSDVGGVASEFTQSDGRRLTLLLLQERRKTWDLRQRLTAAEERTAKAEQRLVESEQLRLAAAEKRWSEADQQEPAKRTSILPPFGASWDILRPYSSCTAVVVCIRLVSKPAFILHASMPEESKPVEYCKKLF